MYEQGKLVVDEESFRPSHRHDHCEGLVGWIMLKQFRDLWLMTRL